MHCRTARCFLLPILLLAVAAVLPAQHFAVQENISIAPYSLPVPSTGSIPVGMTRVTVRPTDAYSCEITQVTVQATSSGAFQDSWVDSIEVYYEDASGNTVYDHGTLIDDEVAHTGGPHTFSAGTATIPISDTVTDMPENTQTANRQLYVVFNLNSSADPTVTLGCEVTSISYHYHFLFLGSGNATLNPTAHGGSQPLDGYDSTLAAAWIGPATVKANGSKVGLLRLDFDVSDATAETYVDSIKVTRTYGQDGYAAAGGILLYADDGDQVFEPDAGDGAYIASASLSSGAATLNPANQEITPAGKSFFVAVNFNTTADQKGQDFGLNIANPSADITFADELEDDNSALAGSEYAYVPGGREYAQLGFITSATAAPPVAPANSVEIDYPDDGEPPYVMNTTPASGATGIARTANLTVVFNEWMNEASAENPANFELTDGVTPVAVSLTYVDATKTLTVNPDTDLVADTLYTATVQSTMTDYYGAVMSGDHGWSFRTVAVYPTVLNTDPADAQGNVDRGATIRATFSEDVSGADATSFTLVQGVTPVPGSVSYNPVTFTATFDPAGPLAYNTVYTAGISTAVYDSDFLYLQTAKVWTFTTEVETFPYVSSTSPGTDAEDVAVDSTVTVTFSEDMDTSTFAANFTLKDPANQDVDGVVTVGGPRTLVFTPDADLEYNAVYTASVGTGVKDLEDSFMAAVYPWSFTTIRLYPVFNEPIILKNRLQPGGNQQALIFVTEPPGGSTDRVSVQVFTTSGRRVATLVNNRPYSSVLSPDDPIIWNGTNDQGKPLGPGLYFVQIRATNYKRVLKVMIVR